MKKKIILLTLVVFVSAFFLSVNAQNRKRNYTIYDPEVEYYRAFNESTRGLRTAARIVRGGANLGTRRNPLVGQTFRILDRQVQKRVKLPKRYQFGY